MDNVRYAAKFAFYVRIIRMDTQVSQQDQRYLS